jgi:hypothetical protein
MGRSMNKLVKVPLKLNPYLASFSDLFIRSSYVSFCRMTTTIAVCNKSKTIFNLHETMADDNNKRKGDLPTIGSSPMESGMRMK